LEPCVASGGVRDVLDRGRGRPCRSPRRAATVGTVTSMHGSCIDRVLMVNKFLHEKGGAELYMYRLAGLLEDREVTVRYFGMRHPRNLPSPTERWYVSQVDFENPTSARQRLRVA